MSDANRVALRYLAESTWNVTPSAAMTNMRYTGESLNFAIDNITSKEIRSDRQISNLVQVGAQSAGGVDWELSYGAMDDLFESALQGVFGTAANFSAATVSAAASDNSFNDSGSGFPVVVPGQVIQVLGFTGDPANNGYFIVVSRTTSKIVVAGGTLVDDAAGETVTIKGGNLRNGTTFKSFTMEKEFTDLSNEFIYFTGMTVDTMTMTLATGEIFTGSFSFLGGNSNADTSTQGTGGPNAAPTNEVMNAVTDLAAVLEDDSPLTGVYIQSLTFNTGNNLRGRPAIGVLGNSSIGSGTMAVTGSISMYFSNSTLYGKYAGGTATSVMWTVVDSSDQGYSIYLPKMKLSTGTVQAGGIDTDVVASFDFTAYMHPTYGFTVQIDRFPGT